MLKQLSDFSMSTEVFIKLGQLRGSWSLVVFARRVTVAEVAVMGATCVGLVEEVDALGGDVRGPVELRPDIKVIEGCSSRNWYMVLERGPVEGRSIGLLEVDALGGPVEGRPGIKSPAGTNRTPQEVLAQ